MIHQLRIALLAVGLFAGFLSPLAVISPALAVQPEEVLDDPALEARARKLSLGLRCLVCQNQSIDDSDAPLAKDLRVLVRERLVAGDSDEAVIDYIVARYGDFVLLKPPLKPSTVLLWIAPLLLLGGGLLLARTVFRRANAPDDVVSASMTAALSPAEKEKVEALLGDGKGQGDIQRTGS